MNDSDFFTIIAILLLLGGVIFIFWRMRQSRRAKKPFLHITDEALGEAFLILSVLFFSVTLLSFNNSLRRPLSWQTIVLLTSALALLYAYIFRMTSSLVVGLSAFASWWIAQASTWVGADRIRPAAITLGLAVIGAFFYLTGRLHERRKFASFAPVYISVGLLIASLLLFFFSTSAGLEYLQDMTTGGAIFSSWKIALSLTLLIAFSLAAALRAQVEYRITLIENVTCALFIILFAAIAFLPYQELFSVDSSSRSVLTSTGITWAIFFNTLFFLEMVGLILLGYHRQDERLVNAGVLFIFIFVFVKYIDWFFKFLDKSVFFIGAGILLLVLGWLMERGRRYVLAGLRQTN